MTKDREEFIEIAAKFYRAINGRSVLSKVMDTVGFSHDEQQDRALRQRIRCRVKKMEKADETKKNTVAIIIAPPVADVSIRESFTERVLPHSTSLSALTDPTDLSSVQVVLETRMNAMRQSNSPFRKRQHNPSRMGLPGLQMKNSSKMGSILPASRASRA